MKKSRSRQPKEENIYSDLQYSVSLDTPASGKSGLAGGPGLGAHARRSGRKILRKSAASPANQLANSDLAQGLRKTIRSDSMFGMLNSGTPTLQPG